MSLGAFAPFDVGALECWRDLPRWSRFCIIFYVFSRFYIITQKRVDYKQYFMKPWYSE